MNKYQAENVRLQALWHEGKWRLPGEGNAADPLYPKGDPYRADVVRLRFVDEFGASRLIQDWLSGRLTWRQLWRIVSEPPGAYEEQAEALKK